MDAGGLLGGRLDEDIVRVPASTKAGGAHLAAVHSAVGLRPVGTRDVKRSHTIPVIQLRSTDRLPAMAAAASAAVATVATPVGKLEASGGCVWVLGGERAVFGCCPG